MSDRDERARWVAASCCGGDCEMCADYIETGNPILRPVSREEYEASKRRGDPS